MKVKPFINAGHYVCVYDAFFDYIMRVVPGNAFKAICLVLRWTDGWQAEDAGLSFREIQEGLGVGSQHTVTSALNYCTDPKHPFLKKHVPADKWTETSYSLNREFELEIPDEIADWVKQKSAQMGRRLGERCAVASAAESAAGRRRRRRNPAAESAAALAAESAAGATAESAALIHDNHNNHDNQPDGLDLVVCEICVLSYEDLPSMPQKEKDVKKVSAWIRDKYPEASDEVRAGVLRECAEFIANQWPGRTPEPLWLIEWFERFRRANGK